MTENKKGVADIIIIGAGGIRQQFSTEANVRLSVESVHFFECFEEETGYPADFRQNGYLMLATTEEEVETFKQNVALQQKLGVNVSLLTPQEVKGLVPKLNADDVLAASYCPSDGYADPYSVVQGFARAAREMGVRFRREGTCLIFGMRNPREPEGFDISVDWGFLPAIGVVAHKRLPLLNELSITSAQAGLHDDTPDNNAIMGGVSGMDNLYLACGFSGHGFMHSPAVGRTIADLIAGRNTTDLTCFALERFKAGTGKGENCFI